jgi:ergothioneine biosynthesis protein EgtB
MQQQLSPTGLDPVTLLARFREVRSATERLVEPLTAEDCVVQSMPDVSPTRWHLAHVSWFFETFLLKRHLKGYRSPQPEFEWLFNSYYNAVGEQFPRPRRGLLTRPTLDEVRAYRSAIDGEMARLLESDRAVDEELLRVVELGLHHEQQHQELMLMDIKHVFSCNPLFPSYRASAPEPNGPPPPLLWLEQPEGLREIGHAGEGFAFDNEGPRHRVFVHGFLLASRLVANGEFLEFVEDGGYERPQHWLADGWSTVEREGWRAPLYWVRRDGFCHLSYFEADAFATWNGSRLPTEAEWETVVAERPVVGNFVEGCLLHPRAPGEDSGPLQLYGDLWEWTGSAYAPYPGFRAAEGALGEYNGKFMCNQIVLRGGACITPRSHVRATYRNFFYPHNRWQFSGLRLARDG